MNVINKHESDFYEDEEYDDDESGTGYYGIHTHVGPVRVSQAAPLVSRAVTVPVPL